jgi:hypothetical protein
MTGRASQKSERSTITADKKDEESDCMWLVNQLVKSMTRAMKVSHAKAQASDKKTKSNENQNSSRFERKAA